MFGRLLDGSWPLLAAFVFLLNVFSASLVRSWASLGCLLGLVGASWKPLARFGVDFVEFVGGFGAGLHDVGDSK